MDGPALREGGPMSQLQQLERVMEIDRQIRAGRYPSAESLAEEMEVSRRVIFNDRNFMIDRLGAPIACDRAKGGWTYSKRTWSLPSSMVTEGELIAFFVSVELSRRYLGTGLEKPLRTAVEKIATSLRGPVSVYFKSLGAHYTFSPPALLAVNEQALVDLHVAIQGRRKVKMTYFTASRGERTARTIDPHHLTNIQGEWYVIAFDHMREALRSFHVGRIEDWEVLKETFVRQREFVPEEYMKDAFQADRGAAPAEIVIRFDAEATRYVRERLWHPSQKLRVKRDGTALLRFRTSGLGALKRWISQYGPHAEVLKPRDLRELMRADAAAMRRLYWRTPK